MTCEAITNLGIAATGVFVIAVGMSLLLACTRHDYGRDHYFLSALIALIVSLGTAVSMGMLRAAYCGMGAGT